MEDKRDIYPIELIKTIIDVLECVAIKKNNSHEGIRGLLLYQLIEIDDEYLPLGRDYKPLGLCQYSPWADYHKYPYLLIPKNRVKIENITHDGILTPGYFFFNDGNSPLLNTKFKKRYINLLKNTFN